MARTAVKRLAQRRQILTEEIRSIDAELDSLTQDANAHLRATHGVGVMTAATLLAAAGDNPERVKTRSAFAALVGVAPGPFGTSRKSHRAH